MHEMAAVEQAPHLMTTAEIAEELRLGRSATLAFLRRRGVPVVRIGREYRVRRADLAPLLEPVALAPHKERV